MNTRIGRMILPLVAGACYAVSFCLPALWLTRALNYDGTISDPAMLGQPSNMLGMMAFINGFFALFNLQLAWLANPLAWAAAGLLLARLRVLAICFAIAAVAVAQHTWAVVNTTINGDEGGVTKYLVVGIGPGFWLWCGSFVLIAIAAIVARPKLPPPIPQAVMA